MQLCTAYSRCGLTNAQCKVRHVSKSISGKFLLISPTIWLPLAAATFTWWAGFRSADTNSQILFDIRHFELFTVEVITDLRVSVANVHGGTLFSIKIQQPLFTPIFQPPQVSLHRFNIILRSNLFKDFCIIRKK